MSPNKLCIVKPEMDIDETICQYMDLDFLLLLLSTKKYFVRLKRGFKDKREKELPLKDMFVPHIANQAISKDTVMQELSTMSIRLSQYREYGALPTSCWTLRQSESNLMWSGYTNKLGACIKSTIGKFVSAVDYSGYTLLYGKISYHGYNFSRDDELFSKESAFADEKELRFYFLPDITSEMRKESILLPVKPKELIQEIVLSPYIQPQAASELAQILSERYDVVAKSSKIQINNL